MDNIKYFLEYSNNEGLISRLEIWEKDFEGEAIEIHGNVVLNYAERKDLLQAFVPSSLDINLEADEEITLQDLYSEDENKFKTKFYFDSQLLFVGILKPDGIWEDWVNDKWEISIDAMDGLSILKELSFVKDDGTFYIGKITQFEALKQCLHRIGYDLPINISDDLPTYNGLTSTNSILHNVLMNADRFYQDKKTNAIMDCEEVLKSILEPYNASIFQMNGEWWVIRANDVKSSMIFKRYDGINPVTTVTIDPTINIGSHIDDYEIHHINANQKKSVNPSAQAFRVNYKYGLTKGLNTNPDLIQNPSGSLNIDGWEILTPSSGSIMPHSDGRGIIYSNTSDEYYTDIFSLDEEINLTTDNYVVVDVNLYGNVIEPNATVSLFFWVSTENYVYDFYRGWVLDADADSGIASFSSPISKTGNYNISGQFGQMPENSRIYVKIGVRGNTFPPKGWPHSLIIKNVTIKPSESNFKGEFHTAQRNTRISSVTKADKTVSVGDSISDIYLGTLYKADEDPTEFWYREGVIESKSLLRIMVEDTLRISPRPMLYFEGDTFGYFPYLSLVAINNILGKFQISKYSYNSNTNINRTAFKEFATEYLTDVTDYRYEFEYDFGQETRVLIHP